MAKKMISKTFVMLIVLLLLPGFVPAPNITCLGKQRGDKCLQSTTFGCQAPGGTCQHTSGGGFIDDPTTPFDESLICVFKTDVEAPEIAFGDAITLVGYYVDKKVAHPGEQITVELWWQATDRVEIDYTAFVHLVSASQVVWAQQDQLPLKGDAPTSSWQPGQVIHDFFAIELAESMPPGEYQVETGFYDIATMQRLQVNGETSDAVLGRVVVED
ncbi:MAG: hypothetical protein H6641_10725 [Caldilineaceae bacterium]|nr:hypothetical protein [Caldilineaceae bacterium]